MDFALIEALRTELIAKGVPEGAILKSGFTDLTGAYDDRPRQWDLVVMEGDQLVAAIEFRWQFGSSNGNNVGNRMAEAVSLGVNFGRAHNASDENAFRPFLGFVFSLEKTAGATYVDRYRDFFRRLRDDQLYDAVCYLTFTGESEVAEPDPSMGFEGLAQSVADHVTAFRKLREHHDPVSASVALRLSSRNDLSSVLLALSDTDSGHTAVEEATDEIALKRRRALLDRLRRIVAAPEASEDAIREAIGRHYWLFGGQYQGLLPVQRQEIRLVCSDRSIHVVELSSPGAELVTRHGDQLILSTAVHEAVSRCMNHIRTLDQTGAAMEAVQRDEPGASVDYLRAKATVVIGDPTHVRLDGVTAAMVERTIRSYNAHLSRVQVLTYADLIDSAERALRFTED